MPPLFFWRTSMPILTDHAFHVGEQHLRQGKPCQDFALSGALTDTVSYATISDGCSSGGQTDIGARLVALATERALRESVACGDYSAESVNSERNLYIETYRRTLQLPVEDMLATSLWATMDEREVSVNITGDGAFALLLEVGSPVLYEITWDKNAPYYPAYRLGGLDTSFKQHQTNPTPLSITKRWIGADEEVCVSTDEHYIEPSMNGLGFVFSKESGLFPSPIIGVGIFSDGVTQVDAYTTEETIIALTSFKTVKGQFFTRRMNRFLQDVKKTGRGPLDDIAGAVLYDQHSPTGEG